jgi:hypothetical protein
MRVESDVLFRARNNEAVAVLRQFRRNLWGSTPLDRDAASVASGREPYLHLRRQIIAGELHCPDSAQRHQALFGLGALFALVAYFDPEGDLFGQHRSSDTVGPEIVQAAGSVLIRFGQGFGELKFLKLAAEHKGNLLVPSPPPSSASIGD